MDTQISNSLMLTGTLSNTQHTTLCDILTRDVTPHIEDVYGSLFSACDTQSRYGYNNTIVYDKFSLKLDMIGV